MSKNRDIQLTDHSTRFWFPLRKRYAYDPHIITNIISHEKSHTKHSCVTIPFMMLYDLMMVKMMTFKKFQEPPFAAYRDYLIPRMSLYASYDTLLLDATWVDEVIDNGWSQSKGVFNPFPTPGISPPHALLARDRRRLPRPPPWSPGDDRWLPGTARGRGTFASVTLRRDPTDLFKFGAAGGQADGSPKKSFKIGKH